MEGSTCAASPSPSSSPSPIAACAVRRAPAARDLDGANQCLRTADAPRDLVKALRPTAARTGGELLALHKRQGWSALRANAINGREIYSRCRYSI